MRNNILTLLVGFLVLVGSVMLFKLGLDKMTDAEAAELENYSQVNVDMNRRMILYRVQPGDTLWGLAERFYGAGKRWDEIARANDIQAGQGLNSGTIIRIPLAAEAESADALSEPPVALPTLSYDEVEAAILPEGREGQIASVRCQFDTDARMHCVAREAEGQAVRISLYSAAEADSAPVSVYLSRGNENLRHMVTIDHDGDGREELYTIWSTDSNGCLSRVLKLVDGQLQVVSETPDDPVAILRLRAGR